MTPVNLSLDICTLYFVRLTSYVYPFSRRTKYKEQTTKLNSYLLLVKFFSAAQRGSTSSVPHAQSPVFLSMPQSGQIPLQSGRQSVRVGTASKICSFTISSTSIVSPSNTETDSSSSFSSATLPD